MKLPQWVRWAVPIFLAVVLLVTGACGTANQMPTIISLIAGTGVLVPGGGTAVTCNASDADGDILTYMWTYTGGTISGAGATVTWEAPGADGTYTITVVVSDGREGTATRSINVTVGIVANNPPQIASLTADPETVAPGGGSTITCNTSDLDGDALTYAWEYTGGSHSGIGGVITWTAPATAGTYTVGVTVDDGNGGVDTDDVDVVVAEEVGSIDISSNPAGAAVYLDGADTGEVTPCVLTNASAGDHVVKLTREYRKDHQEVVPVNAGETTFINWALTLAPAQTVTFQPGLADGKDSYAYELQPNDNRGTESNLITAAVSDTNDCRAFLQFDLSSIPDTAVVTSARLGLYYYDNGMFAPLDAPIGAYMVTAAWDEGTITWNNQPTAAATAEAIVVVPAAATSDFEYWHIDLMAQGWIDGSTPNNGVMTMDTNEATSEDYKHFRSSDFGSNPEHPKLVVEYYDPAP